MNSNQLDIKPKVETIDGSDEDIEIIDCKQVKKEIQEVFESPNIVRKRSQLKTEIKTESNESPISLSKNKNKRVFNVSDDEEDNSCNKQMKTSNDEIARMAFEEMCENTIKELQNLFPEIDICEIQDALIESNWSVFNASIKLGNLCEEPDRPDIQTNGINGSVKLEVKEEPKICTNDEKMKSLDYYRKWKPNKSNDYIEEEDLIPTSSHNFNSIKNNKNKFSKQRQFSEEMEESSEDDSDVEEYTKNNFNIVCDDSSGGDDSDGDSNPESKSSKQIYFKTTDLKEKVVEFLENSNPFEMNTIPGVSAKKAEIIINLRPFADWNDLFVKINASNLSTDILDKCCEVLKAREVVNRLMNSCEDISKDLNKTVEELRPLEQPKLLNPEMKLSHYQMIGLNWLALMYRKGINCILADEMGLGKTIQVIAFFAYLRQKKKKPTRGPHLVIVPSSTLDNWSREFQIWCPDIKLLLYYGSQEERALIRDQISKNQIDFDVIITTYNLAQNREDRGLIKRNVFKYVVFDEAHYLKNMRSSRFEALMGLKAKHRLLLTGTPLQNNLVELMSLLIFTMPHMFRGKREQILTLFSYSNKDSIHRISYINDRILQAKKIMKPFVLRRLKSDVLKELPLKIEHILRCPMSEEQEQKYMELIEDYTRQIKYKKITFEDSETEEKFKKGNGMLMNLRKVANHPLLLRQHYDNNKLRKMAQLMLKEDTHRNADPQLIYEDMEVMHDFELYALCKRYKSLNSFKLDIELILESGKFRELDSLLTKFRIEGKRVLLFSQFTLVLDIIEEYMKLRLYKYLRLDGTTKVCDRLDLIDNYNNDPELFVFLLSTRAGGLGINLTAANVVIIHDIDFNPYNDKQAEDRCHRIGQTKEVIVYRLISQGSVEEGMLKIAEEKLKLGRDISATNQDNNENEELMEKSDVKTLLRAALKL